MPPFIFSGGTPPLEADLRRRTRECVYHKSGGTPPPELTLVFWGCTHRPVRKQMTFPSCSNTDMHTSNQQAVRSSTTASVDLVSGGKPPSGRDLKICFSWGGRGASNGNFINA